MMGEGGRSTIGRSEILPFSFQFIWARGWDGDGKAKMELGNVVLFRLSHFPFIMEA